MEIKEIQEPTNQLCVYLVRNFIYLFVGWFLHPL